jgi:hypothetical protein
MQINGRKMKLEGVHYHSIAGGWLFIEAEMGKFVSGNVICFAVLVAGVWESSACLKIC